MSLEQRNKVLQIAISQIGIEESPAGSNKVKYNTWIYGKEVSGPEYPWCGAFDSWCFDQAGLTIKRAGLLKGFVGCPYAVKNIEKWGKLVDKGQQKPGDIVFYDWQGDGKWDHTGIFEKDNGDGIHFTAIEGNTAKGNDSNGGKVMRRDDRKYSQAIFVRPNVYTN